MDHCKVNDLNGMVVADTVIGVMDHNTFIRATKNRKQRCDLRQQLERTNQRRRVLGGYYPIRQR